MLWICNACTTAYAVDAPCCPHCGSSDHRLSTDPAPEPVVTAKAAKAGASDGA